LDNKFLPNAKYRKFFLTLTTQISFILYYCIIFSYFRHKTNYQ